MKLFLSWSGPRSKFVAVTLRWWLPNVIQAVEPFISAQDIEKGTRGLNTISKHLEESSIGVICLTPENQDKPWILFEAGALSKQATAHVCTLLYDMAWTDVKPPLASFQHTTWSEEELNSLCKTINAQLPADRRLPADRLDEAFETWYPKLAEKMKGVPTKDASEPEAKPRDEASKLDEILTMLRRQNEKKPQIVNFGAEAMGSVALGDVLASGGMFWPQVRPMTDTEILASECDREQLDLLMEQIRKFGRVRLTGEGISRVLKTAMKRGLVQVVEEDGVRYAVAVQSKPG